MICIREKNGVRYKAKRAGNDAGDASRQCAPSRGCKDEKGKDLMYSQILSKREKP